MNEIVLTAEQYIGTAIGAAAVFVLLGMLTAFFYERALRAEERERRLSEWVERMR